MTSSVVPQLFITILGLLFLMANAEEGWIMEQWPFEKRFYKGTIENYNYNTALNQRLLALIHNHDLFGLNKFVKSEFIKKNIPPIPEPLRFQRNVGIMFSARTVFFLLYTLLLTVAIVSAAPNRILMRFGKRTADPVQYRPFVPSDYYPVELLGSSRAADGDM
ncbi:unnamed protein product [Cylicocyclus nassatus]|uniref:Uncharacterized protein n=1 Tax=Cylicocyclus nassatus TaxID=53992 RepID=A0AA36HEE4_CYLNA|nr:unnamed protein product [Cylicocyclus nassatus]